MRKPRITKEEKRQREWSRYGIGGNTQRVVKDDGGFARAHAVYWLYEDQKKGRE